MLLESRSGRKADQITVEAEDALIAALKVKSAHPEAAITYVRKQNARGDRRHPHAGQVSDVMHEPFDRRALHRSVPMFMTSGALRQ